MEKYIRKVLCKTGCLQRMLVPVLGIQANFNTQGGYQGPQNVRVISKFELENLSFKRPRTLIAFHLVSGRCSVEKNYLFPT